jgi:small subunit ribosomal protein S20
LTFGAALRRLRGLSQRPRPQEYRSYKLANTKSAEKAARQALKRRDNNVAARSKLRTVIRDVTQAIGSGTKDNALEQYNSAMPVIDSMVNKSQIHRNKAARHKSRLAQRIRAMT